MNIRQVAHGFGSAASKAETLSKPQQQTTRGLRRSGYIWRVGYILEGHSVSRERLHYHGLFPASDILVDRGNTSSPESEAAEWGSCQAIKPDAEPR